MELNLKLEKMVNLPYGDNGSGCEADDNNLRMSTENSHEREKRNFRFC